MHSTGQDLGARSELQLPQSGVLPVSGQQDGAGTGQGWAPGGPAHTGTQTCMGFQKGAAWGQVYFGGTARSRNVWQVSETWQKKSRNTPLWSLVKRSTKTGWEENPHYSSCSRMLRPGLKKGKPGLVREVLTESGGGYRYKPFNSFCSHLSPQIFLVI